MDPVFLSPSKEDVSLFRAGVFNSIIPYATSLFPFQVFLFNHMTKVTVHLGWSIDHQQGAL